MNEIFTRQDASAVPGLPRGGSLACNTDELEWQSCGSEGFLIKPLLEDSATGLRSWLMKVEAGAFSPLHAHDEIEQIFVLEGSFYDQERRYGPGDYIVRTAGAMHTAGSDDGAVVLLFYSPA